MLQENLEQMMMMMMNIRSNDEDKSARRLSRRVCMCVCERDIISGWMVVFTSTL